MTFPQTLETLRSLLHEIKTVKKSRCVKSKRFQITRDLRYARVSWYEHERYTQRFLSSFIQGYLHVYLSIFCGTFCGNIWKARKNIVVHLHGKGNALQLNVLTHEVITLLTLPPDIKMVHWQRKTLSYEKKTHLIKTSKISNKARSTKATQVYHHGKTSSHAPDWAFPVTFSVTLSSQIKVSRARSASFCLQLVVQLFYFMLIIFFTIFMDNQEQITETNSRLDSKKVSWWKLV